ncbi:MAG: Hsp20/alpha crystallin family protein [Actinomycetota bacterium]|nr:Hsp20/alpha crystallin family protein [Actinomycetota bacterium]
MALIRWEPIPVNRFVNSFFDTQTVAPARGQRRWTPAVDVLENETDYTLRADLPGLSEKDVAIEVENDVLTIAGERRSEHEERTGGYYRLERSSGSFRRSLQVPEGVDPGAIIAQFENGVLEVTIPKPARRTPRKVAITVGSVAGSESSAGSEPSVSERGASSEAAPAGV